MKRRRLVALVSAGVLVVVGLVVLATGYVITRTSYGQEQLRKLIEQQIASRIDGKLYLGRISGGFLSGITIDSVSIRDSKDSLFLATGPITVSYDPRDLMDRRLFLRSVEVQRPVVRMRQYEDGTWNHKKIFRTDRPKGPKAPGRNFGDYVVIEWAHVKDAEFKLSLPWHPDDSLKGSRLDSALRFNLTRDDKEIIAYKDGERTRYVREYHWNNAEAFLPRLRLADPDSNRFGRLIVVDRLRVEEHDPPFAFRNLKGTVRHLGDSIWVDVPHFDLPASTGAAKGKVVWGSSLPVRYDIAVRADSVSLNDVAWVYPTLPRTGGGKTLLHIRNDPSNLRVIDYALTEMDVRSTRSRLRGDMTFAVGGPVLVVKDVDLDAEPMDFELVRTLNGKPFPVDWQGRLVGSVQGPGGPLNRFKVNQARATFYDAHVPGATSRFSGQGELDILFPAFTAFRGFNVDVASLDLRSIEYLFPNFPKLGGTIAGVARLDSSWLDVRFSDANVVHQDGPGDPSRLTGSGRVTWGAQFMTYDVDLNAEPLSLTMLSRSYPTLAMKGQMSGPIKARGTVADLELSTALTGSAGSLSFDGILDAYPPGFAARGRGQFGNLDLAQLLDRPSASVQTVLNGRYDADIAGDSLVNLAGGVSLVLTRSDVDGIRLFSSRGVVRFASGRMRIDTLNAETAAATLSANGALGVAPGTADSVAFRVVLDSLGGIRRYLGRAVQGSISSDSLGGSLALTGVARGRVDSMDVEGRINGEDLHLRGNAAKTLGGSFVLHDALRAPTGSVQFGAKQLKLAGIDFDSVGAHFALETPKRSSFLVTVLGRLGSTVRSSGWIESNAGVSDVRIDTVAVALRDSRWALSSPAHVRRDSLGLALDSLILVNGAGGRLDLRGTVPDSARVALTMRADSIPVADIGRIAQLSSNMSGFVFVAGAVGGTKARPEIEVSSTGRSVRVSDLSVDRIVSTASYRNRRAVASFELFHSGTSAIRAAASLPIDVQLWSASRLDDSLRVSLRADSADFGIVEAFLPSLQHGKGRLRANLEIAGTWTRPTYSGGASITNGEVAVQDLGVTLKGIQASAELVPGRDSLKLKLHAWSGATPADFVDVDGRVDLRNRDDWGFNVSLTARNFHALDKRTLARLDLSTQGSGLQLTGRTSSSVLKGSLVVNRGTVFLPDREIARKQLIALTEERLRELGDTTRGRPITTTRAAPLRLMDGLRIEGAQIALGDEVWLRSREANVKLTGTLNVRSAVDQFSQRRELDALVENGFDDEGNFPRPALEGTISADRGTYTLDLGVVRREFQVQRGTVTFQGTPDNNPIVDITALYNVKRPGQEDLGVIVNLHGPLNPYPVIDFASTANYEISQSDLVSYLMTGQPSFQLAGSGRTEYAQAAANVLLPTASSVLASSLRDQVGSWVDVVQFQGGTSQFSTSDGQSSANAYRELLASTRIGGEKQVSNNLFVSLSAGLCPLYQQSEADRQQISFLNTLGWKIEYRFDPKLSLQAGLEPSTAERSCGALGSSARGLVPTPRQWGFSLFRTWHF